jgi:hypothetical protein
MYNTRIPAMDSPYVLNDFKKMVHNITYDSKHYAEILVWNDARNACVEVLRKPVSDSRFTYFIDYGISDVTPILQYIPTLINLRGNVQVGKIQDSDFGIPEFVVNCANERDTFENLEPGTWNGSGSLTDWFVSKMVPPGDARLEPGTDQQKFLRNLPQYSTQGATYTVIFNFSFPNADEGGDPALRIALAGMAEVILILILKNLWHPRAHRSQDISYCYRAVSHDTYKRLEMQSGSRPSARVNIIDRGTDEFNAYSLGLDIAEPNHDDELVLDALYGVADSYPNAPALTGGIISPNFRRPWPLGARLQLPVTDPPEYTMVVREPEAAPMPTIDPAAFREKSRMVRDGIIPPSYMHDLYTDLRLQEASSRVPASDRASRYFEEAAASIGAAEDRKQRTIGGGRRQRVAIRSKSPSVSRRGGGRRRRRRTPSRSLSRRRHVKRDNKAVRSFTIIKSTKTRT